MEIPYTFDLPAAIAKDKVSAGDKAMGALASAYWVSFAKIGDPNGEDRPQRPRHEAGVRKILNSPTTES